MMETAWISLIKKSVRTTFKGTVHPEMNTLSSSFTEFLSKIQKMIF